ncbi:MAG: TrkH family potassium uptake protein [Proteobacteria bacterium]|nr:TrkH family potassium uptake protein [Pseudomonadota bacterium]
MALNPVLHILGILLSVLAATMLIPTAVDYYYGNADWQAFLVSFAITLFFGLGLLLSTRLRHSETSFGLKQAFLLTNGAWVGIGIFGALPFMLSSTGMGITDAVFESVSGVTTTGSTVIAHLESMSHGILIWRALLQWLGGIGIIVMALAVLPILNIGGMQLFRTEAYDNPDKVIPRAAELAGGIFSVYASLTAIWGVMLMLAGMPVFDAIAHAMTTIATGGFSTRTESVGAFGNLSVEILVVLGMIVGSLPFAHYMALTRGGWRRLLLDPQVRWFMSMALGVSIIITYLLVASHDFSILAAIRFAIFNTVSVMTGTGYSSADFSLWGGSVSVILLIAMFIGGCAGSTTCGVKMFRLQVLAATARVQLAHLLRPHAVAVAYYNRRPIPEGVMNAVMGFFYLYILSFVVIAILLGLTGLDFETSLSAAATSISNVGPGLGPVIGPGGSFAPLTQAAKWIMAVAMILGRLELFTVLVMLMPGFWKR